MTKGAGSRLTVEQGTSDELLSMGYAGNSGTSRLLPDLLDMAGIPDDSSWNLLGANFKLERTRTGINGGQGGINTGLGRGPALEVFNQNPVNHEFIRAWRD